MVEIKEEFLDEEIITDLSKAKIKRLNLGSGTAPLKGYYNIDIRPKIYEEQCVGKVFKGDARKTEFEDNTFNHIRARHLLEHIHYADTVFVLKEWHRILKEQGTIEITVPDIEYVANRIAKMQMAENFNTHMGKLMWIDVDSQMQLYGSGAVQYGNHLSAFTEKLLYLLMDHIGFKEIKIEKRNYEGRYQELIAKAKK